ncbi:ABC transporter substrate-binding protein [Pumilibacter intestinalis]|uniref:ABC transporter substrate-binding protein n=1 Tax=Pumilibacter intestinalis TaxID=2941511 RepID=UPI00203CE752|nr:ABC transporter substrate-binding protein [Pumilibacter intestinalis]
MKKIISKIMCLVFAALAVTGCFTACGNDYGADTVVIFLEYNGAVGSADDEVKAALEAKFLQDTGESINLVLEPFPSTTVAQKAIGAISASSERIDGIISHYSSDSLLTTMITEEKELKDLTSLVAEYAPNYIAQFTETTDPEGRAYHKGMFNGKIYALSTMERNSVFGMLVNRDHMAKTQFNPDEYDVAKDGYKSLTIDEFTTLLRELKTASGGGRPIVAAPYDLEYFIGPVYGCMGYTRNDIVDGTFYPAYVTDSYLKVMEYERMLQLEKLWIENPTGNSQADTNFYAGKSSIYMCWPEVTSQINVARKLKSSIGADCVMLAPLIAEGQTETRGNSRTETAFSGLTVPNKGQNTELLLKFINWLYSSKDNYDIAKYGIEGKHWVRAEVNGAPAYSYPEDKREEFEKQAPYSGLYSLLTNVNVSERIYAGYTEQEAKWVQEVRGFKTFPENGYVDEGMNMVAPSAKYDRQVRLELANFGIEAVGIRAYAWSDADIPDGKTLASMHATLKENVKTKYKNYINFINADYAKFVESLKN